MEKTDADFSSAASQMTGGGFLAWGMRQIVIPTPRLGDWTWAGGPAARQPGLQTRNIGGNRLENGHRQGEGLRAQNDPWSGLLIVEAQRLPIASFCTNQRN